MLIVQVNVKVKSEFVAAFIQATRSNAQASIKEPGIARFDFIQDNEDPAHFVLIEVYRTPEAPAQHKETAHYNLWRSSVEPMMTQPRQSTKFTNIVPDDSGW